MKRLCSLLILSTCLSAAWATPCEGITVVLDEPGVTFTNHQPLQAVVIDSTGNVSQQTVYYDPTAGGVDLDAGWAGANASVYFPALNTGYIWYDGYWVDPAGYYWRDGARHYAGTHWNGYWDGYWKKHNYWGGNWNNKKWREERAGWRGDDRREDSPRKDGWGRNDKREELRGNEFNGRGEEWRSPENRVNTPRGVREGHDGGRRGGAR